MFCILRLSQQFLQNTSSYLPRENYWPRFPKGWAPLSHFREHGSCGALGISLNVRDILLSYSWVSPKILFVKMSLSLWMGRSWCSVYVLGDLPTAQVCLLLVLQKSKGVKWLGLVCFSKAAWNFMAPLLRGECVSGSSSVLPNWFFGSLCGRSRKSQIARGRIREICMILEIGDKGRRWYIRAEAAIPYLNKLVNWSNRVLNVTWPLLTEINNMSWIRGLWPFSTPCRFTICFNSDLGFCFREILFCSFSYLPFRCCWSFW